MTRWAAILAGAVLVSVGAAASAGEDALTRLGSASAQEQAAAIEEIVGAGDKYVPAIEAAYAKLGGDQRDLRERYRDAVARVRTAEIKKWALALAPSLEKKLAWDGLTRNLTWQPKPASADDARKVLCQVCRSAQDWPEEEAVKLLKACLADKSPAVREAAVSALDREEWKKGPAAELLLAALKDESEKVQAAAGTVLLSRGDQRGLAAVLAGALSKDAAIRDQCIQVVPGLIVTEEGKPQGPKFKHTPEEIAVLAKLLYLEDMNARGTIMRLLGMAGDKSAAPALLEALGKESVPKNRRRICTSLAQLRHRPAAAAMVELLKAREEKLRGDKQDYGWAVAASWSDVGDPDAVPAMIGLLGDAKLGKYAASALSWAFGPSGIGEDYTRGGGPSDVLVPAADGKLEKKSREAAPKGDELRKLWEDFWAKNKDKYKWSDDAQTLRPAEEKK
jgi:HEAT repeat protein